MRLPKRFLSAKLPSASLDCSKKTCPKAPHNNSHFLLAYTAFQRHKFSRKITYSDGTCELLRQCTQTRPCCIIPVSHECLASRYRWLPAADMARSSMRMRTRLALSKPLCNTSGSYSPCGLQELNTVYRSHITFESGCSSLQTG